MRIAMGSATTVNLSQLVGSGGINSPGKRFMASGWNTKVLRLNDLLRKDEWIALDEAVVRVATTQLSAVADLRAAGLVRNLGSIGVLIDEYEKVTDIDEAEQSMTGIAPGQRDLPGYSLAQVPVPITFRDFQVNFRFLESSRRRGASIDTVTAELCTRRVAEKLDDMVFNGSTIQIDGAVVLGYTTTPDAQTGTLGSPWTTATTTVIDDVLAMIGALTVINYRGPYALYVPVSYMTVLQNDYSTQKGDRTFIERILAIQQITMIQSTSSLTTKVVLVQLTSDVVDLSVGQDIVTVEWDDMGGLVSNFKIMAAIVPRVKSSAVNQTGIAVYSEA